MKLEFLNYAIKQFFFLNVKIIYRLRDQIHQLNDCIILELSLEIFPL